MDNKKEDEEKEEVEEGGLERAERCGWSLGGGSGRKGRVKKARGSIYSTGTSGPCHLSAPALNMAGQAPEAKDEQRRGREVKSQRSRISCSNLASLFNWC